MDKPIIYQLLPRLWGNKDTDNVKRGSLESNGTGKFSDIDSASLDYIKWLGCSHVWFTGVIRHATKETAGGCMPSNPQFVKGNAGSPYAIVDYYDVNPYLADNPTDRMGESPRRAHSLRRAVSLSSARGSKGCPPWPGTTPITSTSSS